MWQKLHLQEIRCLATGLNTNSHEFAACSLFALAKTGEYRWFVKRLIYSGNKVFPL